MNVFQTTRLISRYAVGHVGPVLLARSLNLEYRQRAAVVQTASPPRGVSTAAKTSQTHPFLSFSQNHLESTGTDARLDHHLDHGVAGQGQKAINTSLFLLHILINTIIHLSMKDSVQHHILTGFAIGIMMIAHPQGAESHGRAHMEEPPGGATFDRSGEAASL